MLLLIRLHLGIKGMMSYGRERERERERERDRDKYTYSHFNVILVKFERVPA